MVNVGRLVGVVLGLFLVALPSAADEKPWA